MKTRALSLLMILCAGLAFQPGARAAAVSISAGIQINGVGDFYQPLSPYGSWVNVGNYGRCWHPTQVAADWRPYSQGHWEYTDVGWYWQSDEPFGWACFHYGSWVDDPQYGWVWIPGTEWSPAWVVWRESDSYIGWAPCGPNLTVTSPSLFVFVDAGHFCDPIRPNAVIVNNTRVINSTRVINNFRAETHNFNGHEGRMRVNAGPDIARVQKVTRRQFTPTPIGTVIEHSRRPENLNRSNARLERERAEPTPANERPSVKEPSGASRQHERAPAVTPRENERSATPHEVTPRQTPSQEKPAVREPSGAAREHAPATPAHEAPAPSTRHESVTPATPRQAPAVEKPAVREPSGAARESAPAVTPHEAPAPSTQREEHRTVTPQSERAPVAPQHTPAPQAEHQSHAAPEAQHAAPAQQDHRNDQDHSHDQQ